MTNNRIMRGTAASLLTIGLALTGVATPANAADAPATTAADTASCAQTVSSFTQAELKAIDGFTLAVLDESDPSKEPVTITGWSATTYVYKLDKPALLVPRTGSDANKTIMIGVKWYDKAGNTLDPNQDGPAWLENTVKTVVTITGLTSKATRTYVVSNGLVSTDGAGESGGQTANLTPIWRLYNPGLPQAAQHLYTASKAEYDNLVANEGWRGEGAQFCAVPAADTSASPVYRVYNPYTSAHHWTANQKEYDNLKTTWNDEGVAWRVDAKGTLPVYRAYNEATGEHLYTPNKAELDNAVANGWTAENIAFNAYPVTK